LIVMPLQLGQDSAVPQGFQLGGAHAEEIRQIAGGNGHTHVLIGFRRSLGYPLIFNFDSQLFLIRLGPHIVLDGVGVRQNGLHIVADIPGDPQLNRGIIFLGGRRIRLTDIGFV